MQQHAADAERVGDQAGMLPAGAAEGIHHVVGDVVAALHRDAQDRVRHVLDRDADEAVGHLRSLAAIADLGGKRGEAFAHDLGVERLVLRWAEDLGEELRNELPNHHIGVGDGERSAAPIAGRPRIGAGRVRPDAEARAVIKEDRSTARRDGMDQHHRRADAHACDHALEGPLVHAVEMADIGGGAAHVEADDAGEACEPRRLHRADHAACRPRQDGVLAVEQMRRGQPARGLHEEEFGFACLGRERRGDPIDISSEQRREIGIDHGGVAAPDEFHQRAHLVTHRDLREAHFVGEARCLALMVWMRISMHEHDGDGVDAVGARGVERGARGGKVERRLHAAVGAQALRHLGDACIEHRRLLYFAREDLWPRLIADLERVAEPFAHQQQDAIALALEQRIGGDRGAHLDAVDQLGRERYGRAASPSRSPMPAVAASA